jgi:hypothetical protein
MQFRLREELPTARPSERFGSFAPREAAWFEEELVRCVTWSLAFVLLWLMAILLCPGSVPTADASRSEGRQRAMPPIRQPSAWWSRNFESPESLPAPYPHTRNTAYWSGLLLSATSSARIASSPTNRRNHVLQATTGPNNGSDYADWALLTQDSRTSRGFSSSEIWLRLRIYFPKAFVPSGFTAGQGNSVANGFAHWHNDAGYKKRCPGEIPSIALSILNADPHGPWGRPQPRFRFHLIGGTEMNQSNCRPRERWIDGPKVLTAHWYDVLQHIKFSPEPRQGLFEAWIDSKRMVSLHFPTLYKRPDGSLSSAYFQCGYYRLASNFSATVLLDNIREGPTRKSVSFGRHARL